MTTIQPTTDGLSAIQEGNEWWKSAVVYQVYPRSFADGNGDGIGDIQGIISRIPHLVKLGVDVVWLSPVYRSPHADAGYDISDYQAIDPLFGTMSDLDQLIESLHAVGIKLVMDLVVNHTSDEHPWFIESRSSRDNPKRDWYWWRDARPGTEPGVVGTEPTNWESFFSGPTWSYDETTGQYYLHLFAAKQPDLNWENPEVRHAVYDMMRWWLDRGIDGFRMDVINLISKHPELPDAVPDPVTGRGDGSAYYANGPRLHEYLKEMNCEVFEGRSGLLTVGEMPGVTVDEAALVTAPEREELNMVFQFEHVGLDHGRDKFDVIPLANGALADNFSKWQYGLAGRGWNSLYLSNHDQPRPVSRFGNDKEYWRESATALGTILHLQQGTPYIYQGEEIGMTNSAFQSIHDFRDVEAFNYYEQAQATGADLDEVLSGFRANGRDNARTPVQWTGERYAGFSTHQPWIDVNANHEWLNANNQYDDPGSVFNHYRALIKLRKTSRAVVTGDFERLDAGDASVFAFTRTEVGTEIRVIANLSDNPMSIDPGLIPHGSQQILGNYGDHQGTQLRPWEAIVLETHTQ